MQKVQILKFRTLSNYFGVSLKFSKTPPRKSNFDLGKINHFVVTIKIRNVGYNSNNSKIRK